jgi:hypothetical protein
MKVEIENMKDFHTSCNFCNKGELSRRGIQLLYPYEFVYTFQREGNGLKATICEECLKELFIKTNQNNNQ